jgi:hypothetical protein
MEPSEDQSRTRMNPVAKKVLPEEGGKSRVLHRPLLIKGDFGAILTAHLAVMESPSHALLQEIVTKH